MKHGIHILGDFYESDLSVFEQYTVSDIMLGIEEYIEKTGMKILGKHVHVFSLYSISMVFNLSESHITFHSWEEDNYVSIDVFLCHHTSCNDTKAHDIYTYLEHLFRPRKAKKQVITR